MGKAAEKCGFLRIQKYPLRQCGKRNCRLLIITDAAARCNNHRLCFCIMGKPVSCRAARAMPNKGALGQRGCLGGVQRGESRLTAELPRRTAGTLRKDAIGVEKKTMQPRGEELSYRRFSRMAEPQQDKRSRRIPPIAIHRQVHRALSNVPMVFNKYKNANGAYAVR